MFKGMIRIFKAIKCSLEEKNRQKKQYKQKQYEIYQEGLAEVSLRNQIKAVLDIMDQDPSIQALTIEIAQEGLPFASDILESLHCEVIPCTQTGQYMLMRTESYV